MTLFQIKPTFSKRSKAARSYSRVPQQGRLLPKRDPSEAGSLKEATLKPQTCIPNFMTKNLPLHKSMPTMTDNVKLKKLINKQ